MKWADTFHTFLFELENERRVLHLEIPSKMFVVDGNALSASNSIRR
jgi:hypothetical protein